MCSSSPYLSLGRLKFSLYFYFIIYFYLNRPECSKYLCMINRNTECEELSPIDRHLPYDMVIVFGGHGKKIFSFNLPFLRPIL